MYIHVCPTIVHTINNHFENANLGVISSNRRVIIVVFRGLLFINNGYIILMYVLTTPRKILLTDNTEKYNENVIMRPTAAGTDNMALRGFIIVAFFFYSLSLYPPLTAAHADYEILSKTAFNHYADTVIF